jgi:hypothetical protein
MQLPTPLAVYEERLVCLWERLVTTLGIHTVRVLLDQGPSDKQRSATPTLPSSITTMPVSPVRCWRRDMPPGPIPMPR